MKGIYRAIVLVSGMLASCAALGETKCAAPPLDTLVNYYQKTAVGDAKHFGSLDAIIKESIALVTQTTNPPILWIGTKFETDSTPVGLLFALHCDGTIIDGADVGSVRELSAGPTLPGYGETILMNSVSSGGTDTFSRSYAIFAIRNGRITMVWQHLSFAAQYAWFQQPDDGEETAYRITNINDKSIELAAIKTTYLTPPGKKPSRDHAGDAIKTDTDVFTYCWNDSQSTYIACKETAAPTR